MRPATWRISGFTESARGDGGTSEAHAARIERRILVERNCVTVGCDIRGFERGLGFFAPDAFGEYVDQQHMCIGSAGDNAVSGIGKAGARVRAFAKTWRE